MMRLSKITYVVKLNHRIKYQKYQEKGKLRKTRQTLPSIGLSFESSDRLLSLL